MSFLWVTIPVSLILAGVMLGLVVQGVRRGDYDDWEGPSLRLAFDDDEAPEVEGPAPGPEGDPTRDPKAEESGSP